MKSLYAYHHTEIWPSTKILTSSNTRMGSRSLQSGLNFYTCGREKYNKTYVVHGNVEQCTPNFDFTNDAQIHILK